MKKYLFISFVFFLIDISLYSQSVSDYNFGFEESPQENGMPAKWFRMGSGDFTITTDSKTKYRGKSSALINFRSGQFGAIGTAIPAPEVGTIVTVKAFMKLENVSEPIGLMLRIDDENNKVLAFDNMMQKGIKGSSNWKEYSVTLPLPENAKRIDPQDTSGW